MSVTKKQILGGFIYTFLEKCGAQGISFCVTIILARLLLPSEYGLIAIALIFVDICDVFVTYGFGNSLIVNQESDDVDFSTCFYFSIVLSLFFYGLIWLSSPFIASFFGYEILSPILRFLGLRLPIVAINSVQRAYVSKQMMFKMFFYATLIGSLLSGIISIIFAYAGFGAWTLAIQSFSNSFFDLIFLWIMVKWRPIRAFSWKRLKLIYDYGWKILCVGLIDKLYSQLSGFVVAKKFSASQLAYCNRGTQFPTLGMNILEPTISNVLFPALSKCNNNRLEMKAVLRRVIRLSTYVIMPFFIGLLCIAKPLILCLLTDKWIQSVIFLQLGCLGYLLRPIQTINSTMIRASGDSALLLKLDIVKKSIGILLLCLSIPYGIIAISVSPIITNLISTLINIMPNRKLYTYGYREQLGDIFPSLFIAILMAIPVYAITYINIGCWEQLIFQIIVGILTYILFSWIFKVESFKYIVTNLKTQWKNR
jgi:O-antigen/teichoic acid export membrane protein